MAKIAKLAIQSNLPQLDRLFDYLIPDELAESIQFGSRVLVPFGRAKKPLEAFVVGFSDHSQFEGKLSAIESVIGEKPVLYPSVFELCLQLAERAATTLGELIKLAVPSHMPRSYAQHQQQPSLFPETPVDVKLALPANFLTDLAVENSRHFVLSEPGAISLEVGDHSKEIPIWLATFLSIAIRNLQLGKSTIVLVPDYREHQIAQAAISALGIDEHLVDYSQELPKSKQYGAFLKALDKTPRIVLGSRSAAFAPCFKLGSILIYDEADRSYFDQSSPYLATRDVALLRQSIEKCSLVFASHSISTDIKRLVDSGYLKDSTLVYAAPRVSVSEPGLRVDSHAYASIKQGLESGPVLVQVSSLGDSTALYCKACDLPARCHSCQGPLWVDASKKMKCRWCNAFLLDHRCTCGSAEFSLGRAGSSRTAAELGRAFPKARVVESTGEGRLVSVARGRTLVVATIGAEPYVDGGYAAVVLLDARVAMGKQNLRALEDAVRSWSNAVAKAGPGGVSVLVGVSGELAKLFALWNHAKIAANELSARAELSMPPAVRLGSISAELEHIEALATALATLKSVKTIGPAPVTSGSAGPSWRLIFKYPYADGVEVAKTIKSEVARISAGKTRVSHSGRTARAITVKMNDAEVV